MAPSASSPASAAAGLASVEIVRDTPLDIQDRWIRVRVDDGEEEILRYGHTVRFDVTPGPHRLGAHNTLSRHAIDIDVEPGQVLRVRCYNEFTRSGPLLMLAIGFAFIKVRLEPLSSR